MKLRCPHCKKPIIDANAKTSGGMIRCFNCRNLVYLEKSNTEGKVMTKTRLYSTGDAVCDSCGKSYTIEFGKSGSYCPHCNGDKQSLTNTRILRRCFENLGGSKTADRCKILGGKPGLSLELRIASILDFAHSKGASLSASSVQKLMMTSESGGRWYITKDVQAGIVLMHHNADDDGWHRQTDEVFTSVMDCIEYISAHDKAKKCINEMRVGDLPKDSFRQKQYYRQAKQKARKISIARTLALINEISG